MSPTTSPPEQGQLVEVRSRPWVVADVDAGSLADGALRPVERREHLVTLRSVEDGAEPDETLQVIWEIEPGARVHERAGLPEPDALDDPRRFAAFLDAVRWGAHSAADPRQLLAPFRSGVEIEAYQLEPLVRAIRMPRVSLLIADDVGLGKTIEAGLVAQELILRYRARRILIVTPADLVVQWREEMRDKFGLEFRIVDSELVRRLRRERGLHANPWTHFPRLITSIDYLKRERPLRAFRETLPGANEPRYPRRWDLLIVDEAHNAAPAGRGRYATDSQRTRTLRELVPHFEHRLFLTATPHNGYDESFGALLELLDSQRFARGVPPARDALRQVMVRRLKEDLPPRFDGRPAFPPRRIETIEVDYTEYERAAHADLRRYAELRAAGRAEGAERLATEFVLKLLKKRLLSSPAAFARTLEQHRASLASARTRRRPVPASESVLQRQLERVDEGWEDEQGYQEAEDEAQATAGRLFRPLSDEERQVLDRLAAWAERARTRPDAKARALVAEIERICRPGGEWNDERLIVFTEYRDTQKWLLDILNQNGLTAGGRTEVLHGGMDAHERARVKAAFQADPADAPVRVLVGTDAASEGINLQRHCHRVIHYEIPWNPNRLEQRNGRVDRHGQRANEVLIAHFVPRGWERMQGLDTVPVGDLEGDLEFLRRAAVKVEAIRDMLGKVGPVIADQVSEAMLGRRRTLETTTAERDGQQVRRKLAFERRLEEELRALQASYDETRAQQRLTPEHIRAVVETGLELGRQPPLGPGPEPNTYWVPALSGPWARAAEGLEHPFTGRPRPITFDPYALGRRDDLVLCHLGHRLVQMALRLLRAEVFQPRDSVGLHRVTASLVDDPRLREPVAVVYARLVVTGADGHRLHEEVVQAGGIVRDGKLERQNVTALADALAVAPVGPVPDEVAARLLAAHPGLIGPLLAALDARVRERTRSLRETVALRRDEEVRAITQVLEELREQIAAELAAPPDPQLSLWAEDERRQRELDREFLRARLDEIPDEIERETAALRRRFADPTPRAFPIAVEYRVPRRLAL